MHYVAYNKTNMETIFSDVLSNRSFEKYEKIRWTGHQTALKFHTTQRRASFLHNLAINSYPHGWLFLTSLRLEKNSILAGNTKIIDYKTSFFVFMCLVRIIVENVYSLDKSTEVFHLMIIYFIPKIYYRRNPYNS